MSFVTRDVAMDVIDRVREPLERLEKRDRGLADQARRAATSIVLNIVEGNQRKGGDRVHLFRVASGSAAELAAALEVAVRWRYIKKPTEVLELIHRLGGLLYGLTRIRRHSRDFG